MREIGPAPGGGAGGRYGCVPMNAPDPAGLCWRARQISGINAGYKRLPLAIALPS
jgi:hypothetical protein